MGDDTCVCSVKHHLHHASRKATSCCSNKMMSLQRTYNSVDPSFLYMKVQGGHLGSLRLGHGDV